MYRPSSGYMIFADDADSHPLEGALAGTRTLQIPTDMVWGADSPASHPNSPILGPPREPSQKRCPFDCKGQILTVKECRRLARAQNAIWPAFAGLGSSASAVLHPAEFTYILMDYVKISSPSQACALSFRTSCFLRLRKRCKCCCSPRAAEISTGTVPPCRPSAVPVRGSNPRRGPAAGPPL